MCGCALRFICTLCERVKEAGCVAGDMGVQAGRSGREATQIRADTETDGDFTPK